KGSPCTVATMSASELRGGTLICRGGTRRRFWSPFATMIQTNSSGLRTSSCSVYPRPGWFCFMRFHRLSPVTMMIGTVCIVAIVNPPSRRHRGAAVHPHPLEELLGVGDAVRPDHHHHVRQHAVLRHLQRAGRDVPEVLDDAVVHRDPDKELRAGLQLGLGVVEVGRVGLQVVPEVVAVSDRQLKSVGIGNGGGGHRPMPLPESWRNDPCRPTRRTSAGTSCCPS